MRSIVLTLALLTSAQWQADVDFLAREMPLRHKNLFHDMTRGDFEAAVARLRSRIPKLDDPQIVAEIQKIGTMVGDAHTGITPTRPELRFTAVPLRLYVYSDGVFVQGAPKELEVVGARVVRIGEVPIDEVLRRARDITDHSNDGTVRAFIAFKIVRPEILLNLGVIDRLDPVPFTFEIGGVQKTIPLHSMGRRADGFPNMGGIAYSLSAIQTAGWIDARAAAKNPAPLYLTHADDPYWFEYLEPTRTLYIQCNQVSNRDNGETLAEFFNRAYAAADERHADRVVLDLRLNGGGDNTLILPIVHGIIKRDAINRKGHFFVIIGRMTQSAAQNLVNLLERHTQAIFVGEPTGERPNHYGEPVGFELPNSGLHVNVSTLWWQDVDPRDTRDATSPQIPAPLTSTDYATNRDPAMAAIDAVSKEH